MNASSRPGLTRKRTMLNAVAMMGLLRLESAGSTDARHVVRPRGPGLTSAAAGDDACTARARAQGARRSGCGCRFHHHLHARLAVPLVERQPVGQAHPLAHRLGVAEPDRITDLPEVA